jgi:hypothetical protein
VQAPNSRAPSKTAIEIFVGFKIVLIMFALSKFTATQALQHMI